MKLEYPYTNDFKSGTVSIRRNDNRRIVTLTRYDGSKTTTSYARYRMSVKLKRYLNHNEHVDHIDEDRTNDSDDNIQILTQSENNKKANSYFSSGGIKDPVKIYKTYNCEICGSSIRFEGLCISCSNDTKICGPSANIVTFNELQDAFIEANGNHSQMARILGCSRRNIQNWLLHFGIY